MLTTLLDIVGVACLAVLAYFVWAPAPLGVVGFAALLASRQLTQRAAR